jgi:hypothetical protein
VQEQVFREGGLRAILGERAIHGMAGPAHRRSGLPRSVGPPERRLSETTLGAYRRSRASDLSGPLVPRPFLDDLLVFPRELVDARHAADLAPFVATSIT